MVEYFGVDGRKEALIQAFGWKIGGGRSPFGRHRHRWEDTIKIRREMNWRA